METPRFADDRTGIRIENLGNDVVGSLQFYGRFIYQFVLDENHTLLREAEIS
jgi:hypothetical protein